MNIKDVININHGLLTLFYIFRFNMNSISNSEKSYYKKNTNPIMTPWLIYFSFLNSETQIKETWRILISLAPFTWGMKRKSLLLVITGVAICYNHCFSSQYTHETFGIRTWRSWKWKCRRSTKWDYNRQESHLTQKGRLKKE